jgi:hypothetical protein
LLSVEDGLMIWRRWIRVVIEEAWGFGGARMLLMGVKE